MPKSLFNSAVDPLMPRSEMEAVLQRAIKMSKADSIICSINHAVTGNTRFAANQLSTAGAQDDAQLTVQSSFGPKHALTQTNDLSEESIRRCVAESERLAKLAPDDPEAMPELGPQQYVGVNGFFDATAAAGAEERARAALTALQPARSGNDLTVAGYIVNGASGGAIANSKGMSAHFRNTTANYTVTARTTDGTGSGWAAADDKDWRKIDFAAVSAKAAEKARLSRNPVAIEPGRYTVILEPQAVGDLVQLIAFYLDARQADEGRSPFVKKEGGSKVGERILDPRITIVSDPADPQLLSQPFDFQGLPLGRQLWVENGVLKQLYYSRFWAQKQGKTATGFPTSFKMMGGTTSVDEMVRTTQRGVLVTRLWYLREVDPRTILYTGLTRDGTFLVENGKITKALRNFRFNESPLFMLNNLEALGRPERLAGTEAGGDVVMPAVKVREFNFTSLSEAV